MPDDVKQVFTKCGILKEDDDGRPRVKIYRDKATGMVKGDGLVSYLKPPSVRTPAHACIGLQLMRSRCLRGVLVAGLKHAS